ncbi:MAG: hypothetical protein D5R98_05010, partial [Desulfonatronovibrio sp. MSAO_Bac4]
MSQDKLKFYEEVLELEPGSKLFFPLAKLYFLNKDTELAINTLTKGLEKYPEHLEAKLLLASIHKQAGNTQQSRAIHQDIFALFSSNQEFWDSIATDLAENGQNDLALAASFFSMSARQKDATWSDIMWSGLKSLNMPHAANDKSQETISHHPSGSLETEPELPVPDSQQEEPSQEQSYEDRHVQHPEETPVADEDIDPTETEFLPETKTPSEASEPQEKSDPEDGQLDLDQDLISREDPSSLSKEDQELDLDAMFEPMDQEDDSQDSETQDPLADFDENFETEDKKTVETPDDPEVQKDTPDQSLEETPEDDLEKSLQEQDAQPEQLERTATGETELYEDPEELDDFDLESDAKTRSMADILFGQEEYAKALDIYEELWKSSLPGQEREHLDEMINKTRQAMVEQEDSQEKPEDEHEQ